MRHRCMSCQNAACNVVIFLWTSRRQFGAGERWMGAVCFRKRQHVGCLLEWWETLYPFISEFSGWGFVSFFIALGIQAVGVLSRFAHTESIWKQRWSPAFFLKKSVNLNQEIRLTIIITGNKALLRDYEGTMAVNNPLIRPYIFGGENGWKWHWGGVFPFRFPWQGIRFEEMTPLLEAYVQTQSGLWECNSTGYLGTPVSR